MLQLTDHPSGTGSDPKKFIAGIYVAKNICTLICSWLICTYHTTNQSVANQEQFFRALGTKLRKLRKERGYSQEDMLSFGFSTRHWQQVEAGRPITVTTLLRICEVFEVTMAKLVRGLDSDIYEKLDVEPRTPRKRRS